MGVGGYRSQRRPALGVGALQCIKDVGHVTQGVRDDRRGSSTPMERLSRIMVVVVACPLISMPLTLLAWRLRQKLIPLPLF